jgi:sirohydrochlorin ferrochelatase
VKYFVVKNVSYSSSTTVTVPGGSDYSLANAAITSPYISYEDGPDGFPTEFDFATTSSGWTSPTENGKFSLSTGGIVWFNFRVTGTSNDTKTAVLLPIRMADDLIMSVPIAATDNSVDLTSPGYGVANYLNGQTSLRLGKTYNASVPSVGTGSWTASGTKTVNGTIVYPGEAG